MTLRHLQIFLMVCEKENMTEAANALFMTQPSVSQVIRELEEHYKVQLFIRKNRGLSITQKGELLRSYAIHIVNSFDEIEMKLSTETENHALRIGANVTVGVTMIQPIIHIFQAERPGVRVEIFVNNSRAILERINRNELDLAFVEEFPHMENYNTEPFFEDRNIVVAPNDHPYLKKPDLCVEDLARTDMMLRESGSGVRNLFDAVMYTKGIVIHPIWESYTSDALIEAVKADLGLAVLPERIARLHIQQGQMKELIIPGLDLSRKLVVLKHRSKSLSEDGEFFIDLVKKHKWESNS